MGGRERQSLEGLEHQQLMGSKVCVWEGKDREMNERITKMNGKGKSHRGERTRAPGRLLLLQLGT